MLSAVRNLSRSSDMRESTGALTSRSSVPDGDEPVVIPGVAKQVSGDNSEKRGLSINDFDVLSKIGEGGFGTVLLVRKKTTGKLYALKVLVKKNMRRTGDARRAISESAAMQEIKHPFVVTLHFAFQDTNHIYFVLEFVGGGDLYSHLERQTFPESWAQIYIAEIALAIQHVHNHDFVYRDLKPENILVAHDGHLKLADFGLAKKLNSKDKDSGEEGKRGRMNTMIGTMAFSAPEMFLEKDYGKSVDWWALGLLFCEMVTGDLPLVGVGDENVAARVESFKSGKHLKPLPRSLSKPAADLIRRFLSVSTKKRMCCGPEGFAELQKHPFFAGLNWDKLLSREVDAPLKPLLAPGMGGDEMRVGANNHIVEREADLLSTEFGQFVREEDAELASRYAASAALCEAAASSDITALRGLVDAGTDVNAGDYDKRTAIHLAASEGLTEVVKFLVEEANADVNVVDRWNNTPLDDAMRSHHKEVVDLLYKLGAKKGHVSKDVTRASRALSSMSNSIAEICDAAARGDLEALQGIRDEGVDMSAGDYDKRTPLHLAASEGLIDVVKYLIEECNVDPSPVDRWGGTPLDDAVRGGNGVVEQFLRTKGATTGKAQVKEPDTVADLIDAAAKADKATIENLVRNNGVDVNAGDYDKRTAIHLAASEGNLAIVEFLVDEMHASVNPVDRWGGTPLDDAVRSRHKAVATYLTAKGGYTAKKLLTDSKINDQSMNMCDAASQGNVMAIRVLMAQGVDVNQGDYDQRTALHLAASEGMLEMVKVLVKEAKADVNVVDRWGGTPLDDGIRHKHQEVVDYITKNGGKRGTRQDATIADLCDAASKGDVESMLDFIKQGVDVDAGDYDKRTPLHLAASEGLMEVVKLLIEQGKADASPVDRWGGTPLDDAIRHKHSEVQAYIRERGGKQGSGKSVVERALEAADAADAPAEFGGATPARVSAFGEAPPPGSLRALAHGAILCAAAAQGRAELLKDMIVHQGISANAKNYDGRTALHLAAAAGELEVVKLLLDKGRATLDVKDRWGHTPIDDAVREGRNQVVEHLHKLGAKHSATGSDAAMRMLNVCSLCNATARGNIDQMRELILAHGPSIARGADYDKRTALHVAAADGHLGAVRLLLTEAKANVNAADRWGHMPLDDAINSGVKDVVDLLKQHGATKGEGDKNTCCVVS